MQIEILNSKTVSLLLAILFSFLIMRTIGKRNTNFENLALGEETKAYFAHTKTDTFHFNDLSHFAIVDKKENAHKNILILGNSQTHSINQLKDGDVNYVQLLHDSLALDYNIKAITMPNMSLQEMYLSFEYIKIRRKISLVVIPVFMDDLREDGIRGGYFFHQLSVDKFKIQNANNNTLIDKINLETGKFESNSSSEKNEMAALENTPQEVVETYLNNKLSQNSAIWENRPQVRGDIFNFLYIARNTILGINAQTKRSILPKRYEDNLGALELILDNCQKNNIKALVYVPPLRSDVEIPYDKQEYSKFKEDLKVRVENYKSTHFLNLDNIVPGQYWGVKNSTNMGGTPEYDFMHFQFEGHFLLYKYLKPEIINILDL